MTRIRMASPADATAIAEIYAPIVEGTAISFEEKAPSPSEMAGRIASITAHYPWLVLEDDEAVSGYAYASRHRERAAYRWSVDTAVYVSAMRRGTGVGRALYDTLFQLLREQGYFTAYAGVTLPNEASVGLHQAVGFKPLGVYHQVGYKLGAWRDVAWFEADLQPKHDNPVEPRPISTIVAAWLPRYPTSSS